MMKDFNERLEAVKTDGATSAGDFMSKGDFLSALGYSRTAGSHLSALGGVYAPIKFFPSADPKYHRRQLDLIIAVGMGVISIAEATMEWRIFCQKHLEKCREQWEMTSRRRERGRPRKADGNAAKRDMTK